LSLPVSPQLAPRISRSTAECYQPNPAANTKRSRRCTSSPTEGWCRVRSVHRTSSYVPLPSVTIITIVDLWGWAPFGSLLEGRARGIVHLGCDVGPHCLGAYSTNLSWFCCLPGVGFRYVGIRSSAIFSPLVRHLPASFCLPFGTFRLSIWGNGGHEFIYYIFFGHKSGRSGPG
jgi:hypothetical protein